MPTVVRTIRIPVTSNADATFEVPGGVDMEVQAVYVDVDASLAGDTTAELTITEQSGVVIAKKRQSSVIPAGSTGSATWAQRLDDGGGTGSLAGFLHWGVNTDSSNLGLTLTGHGAFSFTTGGNNFTTGTGGGAYSVTTSAGGVTFDLTSGAFGGSFAVSTKGLGTIVLGASNSNFSLQTNQVQVQTSGSATLVVNSVNYTQSITGSGSISCIHDYTVQCQAGGFSGGTYTVSADAGIVHNIHKAGSVFKVTDASGNSIMELTG